VTLHTRTKKTTLADTTINPDRLCYACTTDGQPCRATAVRGQLQCFAHGPRGRRIRLEKIERERRRRSRRPPLAVPELADLVVRLPAARYFPALIAASRAYAKG
jgi:hypothetical protein